jgi:hypothetical protein
MALDVVAWVTGYPVIGFVLALLGLLVLTLAVQGWRTNRWLEKAEGWDTGHRREITDKTTRRHGQADD